MDLSLGLPLLASWSQALHWAFIKQHISVLQRPAVLTRPSSHPPCHTDESLPIGLLPHPSITPVGPAAGAGTEWHL